MKLDPKQLLEKLRPVLGFIKQSAVFMFVLVFLAIFGFFVFRINQYSRIEPSEEAIQEKLQVVQRPKIDQSVLEKVEQLEDQNVQVKSLFNDARNNPFTE